MRTLHVKVSDMTGALPYQHQYDLELEALAGSFPNDGRSRKFIIEFIERTVADVAQYVEDEGVWNRESSRDAAPFRDALYRARKRVYVESGRCWQKMTLNVTSDRLWTVEFEDRPY